MRPITGASHFWFMNCKLKQLILISKINMEKSYKNFSITKTNSFCTQINLN